MRLCEFLSFIPFLEDFQCLTTRNARFLGPSSCSAASSAWPVVLPPLAACGKLRGLLYEHHGMRVAAAKLANYSINGGKEMFKSGLRDLRG